MGPYSFFLLLITTIGRIDCKVDSIPRFNQVNQTTTPKTTTTTTTTTPYPVLHDPGRRDQACDLLIGVDESLWREHDKNMTEVKKFLQFHVDFANEVYGDQVFTEGNGYPRIYFRLKRIQVMFETEWFHVRNQQYICAQYKTWNVN